MKPLIIAIDGPSGAGKGTVARAVAAQLGYRHVDSGAMYRAVGWRALRDQVPFDDEAAIARMAEGARIEVSDAAVTIDAEDVTHAIRTPDIDRAAAAVARLPRVRHVLVERQRQLGAGGGIVMEGRDIGTVVFPEADVKLYLDASPEERARRRAADPAHSARSHSRQRGRDGAGRAGRDRSHPHRVAPLRRCRCGRRGHDRENDRRGGATR